MCGGYQALVAMSRRLDWHTDAWISTFPREGNRRRNALASSYLVRDNRQMRRWIRDRLKLVLAGIRGRCSLRDVGGELVPAFKPRLQRPRSPVRHSADAIAVVLSPHLDDAVLSCWSVLTSSSDLIVVNVFTGGPRPGYVTAWDRFTGASDSLVRRDERLREDEEALAMAGCSSVNLGFPDQQYRRRSPSTAALVSGLADHLPRVSRVYAPAGIGGHVDHLLTREMAKAISRESVPVELYAELPYAVTYGWPACSSWWTLTGSPTSHRRLGRRGR